MIRDQPGDVIVDGFSTPKVERLTGVPPSTLDHWVREGLVTPSLHPGSGRRATRWWSVEDVILVKALRALREAGCPFEVLKRAKQTIEEAWDADLSRIVLIWTGKDILSVDPWADVRSVIVHPGQGVLRMIAIPLPEWRDAVAPEVEHDVNISHLQRLADRRGERPSTPVAELARPRTRGL